MKCRASLLASVTLCAVFVVPQSAGVAAQAQEEKTVTLNSELVVVDALVLNKNTRAPVFDLRKEDFSVYENGKKQEIEQFSRDQLPLSVVLMVENFHVHPHSQDMHWAVFESGKQVLRSLKDNDEVALVYSLGLRRSTTGDFASIFNHDFTTIKGVIEDKLRELLVDKWFPSADTIRGGIHSAALLARKPMTSLRRRIIIAITKDGKNYQAKSYGPTEEETRRQLLSCGAAVYGILLDDHDMESKILNRHPIVIAMNKFTLTADIRNYTRISGGSTVEVEGPEDVGPAVRRIFDDVNASYTLAYYPSDRKLDGKFRKIEVKVSRAVEKREGGIIVRTRKGYYALPPQRPAQNSR